MGFVAVEPGESWRIEPTGQPLQGELQVPGDRSITHRALIIGSMALGHVHLKGALECADTVGTRRVLAHLGVTFTTDSEGWLVISRHEKHFTAPMVELDCGRSASTLRLMAGLLAGQRFKATLTGDDELLSRPVQQLLLPLTRMGATVDCLGPGGRPPVRIKGQPLYPLEWEIPADLPEQKSVLLLAALSAVGASRISEPQPTRDHTERMLRHMGIGMRRDNGTLVLKGEQLVQAKRVKLPRDLSSAAPFIVAASLLPDSDLVLPQVGTNPTRVGLLRTLNRIGGRAERIRNWQLGTEPVSDLRIRDAPRLSAFSAAPNLAPSLIDEFALLALIATQAQGTSRLKGGARLRNTPRTGWN